MPVRKLAGGVASKAFDWSKVSYDHGTVGTPEDKFIKRSV